MRGQQLLVTTWVLFTASGCASSMFRRVEREPEVRLLDASTDDVLVTPHTRLDPSSSVRFELGPRKTDWLPATLLEVSHEGVLFRASLEGPVTEVKITGVTPARRNALVALDVPAALTELDDRVWVTLTELDDGVWVRGADVRDWLDAAARTGSPEPREHWRVLVKRTEEGGRLTELCLPGSVIAEQHGLPASWAELVSWSELNAFRTNRFNTRLPATLALVVATLATFGTTDLWFIDFVAAPSGVVASLITGSSAKREDASDYDEDPTLHLPLHAEVETGTSPMPADAHPIFTPSARRKHVIRPEVSVESGGELLPDDRSFGSAAWVGVRLFDRFELSGGADAWWPEPLSRSGWALPGPLAVRRPASRPYGLAAGRAQLVLDVDADRRLSLLFGAQLSGGNEGIFRFRFTWGLQVRLAGGLFLAVRPFTPAYTFGWPPAGWRYPSTLELGCSF